MKRKILGMTVAIIVIISLLIVNVPAEEKENNELKKVMDNEEKNYSNVAYD